MQYHSHFNKRNIKINNNYQVLTKIADTFLTLLGIQEPVPKNITSGNGLPENYTIKLFKTTVSISTFSHHML